MNAKRLSTSSYVDGKREDETISLQLNGNRLVMNDTGNWVFESTDLDNATYEIEKLVSEKLMLIQSLTKIMKQAEDLQKEVVESNEIKTGVLESRMDTSRKRMSNRSRAFKRFTCFYSNLREM